MPSDPATANLTETFSEQVAVDNQPSGNTIIGAAAVATSPADGYTQLFATGATLSIHPLPYG